MIEAIGVATVGNSGIYSNLKFKTFQSTHGFLDASAFSAYSTIGKTRG